MSLDQTVKDEVWARLEPVLYCSGGRGGFLACAQATTLAPITATIKTANRVAILSSLRSYSSSIYQANCMELRVELERA